jgi:hypothetical protein
MYFGRAATTHVLAVAAAVQLVMEVVLGQVRMT